MYSIFIVEYVGPKGSYVPHNNLEWASLEDATGAANDLVRITGKCYAVFFGESKSPCYETSNYYAQHKLPRRNKSARFDVV